MGVAESGQSARIFIGRGVPGRVTTTAVKLKRLGHRAFPLKARFSGWYNSLWPISNCELRLPVLRQTGISE